MKKVTIYTTVGCAYCVRARSLLETRGVPFEEIDVTGDTSARQRLVERTRRWTVPQIFIGDESIGGFDELSALDRSGRLGPKLA
jgi:glutaredoxin 3